MATTTATTDGRLADLPKNRTGLFASDTLQEVKSAKHQLNAVSTLTPRHRQSTSSNALSASAHSKSFHRQLDGMIGPDSPTSESVRNAFPPSPIRRQKARMAAMNASREHSFPDPRDLSSKPSVYSSPASARLRSEIEQIQSKLKLHGELNKLLALPSKQDAPGGISSSALSYTASCRLSSASTIHTHSRMHPRLPSAVTNGTVRTLTSIPSVIDTSVRSMHSPTTLALPSPAHRDDEQQRQESNFRVSHAYQIPRSSNVGSESVFVSNPSAGHVNVTGPLTRKKSHISCPFYVMYFTNLALQQRRNENAFDEGNGVTSSPHKSSTGSHRRQVHRPTSVKDDEGSSFEQNKRFSAKMAAFENENSHLLKDLLRTTSWNHVQV